NQYACNVIKTRAIDHLIACNRRAPCDHLCGGCMHRGAGRDVGLAASRPPGVKNRTKPRPRHSNDRTARPFIRNKPYDWRPTITRDAGSAAPCVTDASSAKLYALHKPYPSRTRPARGRTTDLHEPSNPGLAKPFVWRAS